jgi:hypothetical protein
MSARLRNESASAKRGARSGAGQRSTSSLSHARPGCAGADKRKLRNVESRDGLDKDLEMPKEPNGVLISSAGQPSERGWAVDDSNWRFDESSRAAHKRSALAASARSRTRSTVCCATSSFDSMLCNKQLLRPRFSMQLDAQSA